MITGRPESYCEPCTSLGRFILLACDGLFKVFTPEEAVNFIVSCLEVRPLRGDHSPPLLGVVPCFTACVEMGPQESGHSSLRSPHLTAHQDEKIQSREGKAAMDARYEAACNRLANKAVQRGSADNVTVMVVRVGC